MQRTVCLLKNWKLKNERLISCFHNDRKGFFWCTRCSINLPSPSNVAQKLVRWYFRHLFISRPAVFPSLFLDTCWTSFLLGFLTTTQHISPLASIIVEEQYISMCNGTFNNLPDYLKNVSYKLNRCLFDSVAFLMSWHWRSSKWRSDVLAVMSLQSCCRAAFISLSYSEQLHQILIMSLCLIC